MRKAANDAKQALREVPEYHYFEAFVFLIPDIFVSRKNSNYEAAIIHIPASFCMLTIGFQKPIRGTRFAKDCKRDLPET